MSYDLKWKFALCKNQQSVITGGNEQFLMHGYCCHDNAQWEHVSQFTEF